MDLSELVVELGAIQRRLRRLSSQPYWIASLFCKRKALMALSDDINGVTSSLAQVADQFPAAISSALSTAAVNGATDPRLAPAVSNLVSQASTTISVLQSSLPTV